MNRFNYKITLFMLASVIQALMANGQFSKTYDHGFSEDHTSLVKRHNGHGYIQASTIQRATKDIHLMKLDVAGNAILDVTFQTPANDECALDVCLGNNDTYLICGYENVGGLDLGFVMSVDSSFNFLSKVYIQVAGNNKHTPALKIINSAFYENPTMGGYWPGDITGGYLVVGFEAVGYGAVQSKSAYAMKLTDALTFQWARKFNSPILAGANDWDMCSNANWKWTGPFGYLIGGSGTSPSGEQAAMATLLNTDGTVVWSQLYADNATSGSWCVAADGAYDDAESEFYQLVNFSQTQSGGIVAMNQNTGAINPARTRYLISPHNDYYTYEFGSTCAVSTIFISGYGLNQTSGATQGIFPFVLRYDKNTPTVDAWGPHYAYQRQSTNYTPALSIFSPFSTAEQPRIFYPKHFASRIVNVWSVAGYEDAASNAVNHFITPYFDGKDSCDFIDPMIVPVPINTYTYPLNNISTTYTLPAAVNSVSSISANVNTCCPVNADFTYTDNGTSCTYTFTATGAGGMCSNFKIKDISNVVIASGSGTSFIYNFTVNGSYTVCFQDCAMAAGSICSQETCQTIHVTCALPCGPVDADFSFTVSGCDVFVSDLTPEGNPFGCEHWNFGTLPTRYSTDTTTFHFYASGDYTICHTECCMDSSGTLHYLTVCKTVTITCTPPCCLPTDFIIAGTGCCYQFTPVFGNGTCPGLSYLWTFDDGSISNSSNPYHCYTHGGIFTVTFSAFCGMGPSITFTKTINVVCSPPPPCCTGGLGISYKGSGTKITVKAVGPSWPLVVTCCHSWTWGDGATSQGLEATHYYAQPGTYEVSCTVTHTPSTGSPTNETVTQTITVNHTEECMCTPDQVLGFAGSPVSCSMSGHSTFLYVVDNIGEANMTYQWMISTSALGTYSDLIGAEGIQTWVENIPVPSFIKCRCTCNTTGATYYTQEVSMLDGHFDATLTATPASICAGGSSVLGITPAGSNVVSWTPASVTGSNLTVSPSVTTLYKAFVNNASGCGSLAQAAVAVSSCIVPTNDSPSSAVAVSYSSNMNYPNCYPIMGDNTFGSDSPESVGSSGPDSWYRFVAQSTGVSISLTSSTADDVIELYQKVGTNYVLMAGGLENAASGASDFERLNYQGLTPGATYYISAAAATGTGAVFALCIQNLMPSGCASVIPLNGFSLCDNYKAIYRGGANSGVSYDFHFTGTGGGAPTLTTSLSSTSGLINLNHSSLALRYGGMYSVAVDVIYALANGAGVTETITIAGNSTSSNCGNVFMIAQPLLEVKADQRCPAVLLRSSYLIGKPVAGNQMVCGILNYTYEFTQVVSCSDASVLSLFAVEYNTGPAPYLPLGVLQSLSSTGAWKVRIRPNFSYGSGTYGPPQFIAVNGTAAGMVITEQSASATEKQLLEMDQSMLYPNPNKGERVTLQLSGIESKDVMIQITDELGRRVYSNTFFVEEVFYRTIEFDHILCAGVYSIQCVMGKETRTERMVVQK